MKEPRPITRLLVANRGEIACRIMRTARDLGIETLAIHSDPDRDAAHVSLADEAIALGGDTPATSYLDVHAIVDAAVAARADAIHPGYGFLAENATFARTVAEAGMVFVGPSAEAIDVMGDKVSARALAADCGLPVIPSAAITARKAGNAKAADALGYPVLVKAAAGGGGRGMRVVREPEQLADAVAAARREAGSAFGDDRVYLEKYVSGPRHVEIQVIGDGAGAVMHLGERECSVQRRHQKIVEEAPSPNVDGDLREQMGTAAVRLASAMDYRGVGTVEFILAPDRSFYFLEMNTRLQVEHAVTEMVTSTDLVRTQLEIAAGAGLPEGGIEIRGHAIECRVYAEDPANQFLPTGGRVLRVEHPAGPGVRVDSALYDGFEVPLEYDPMLAKVVTWAPDRSQAIARMIGALGEFSVLGVTTNIPFLVDVLRDPTFVTGDFTTTTIEERYGEWSPGSDADSGLAAAAAALLATSRAPGGGASQTPNRRSVGPWQTLGAWRLGTGGR